MKCYSMEFDERIDRKQQAIFQHIPVLCYAFFGLRNWRRLPIICWQYMQWKCIFIRWLQDCITVSRPNMFGDIFPVILFAVEHVDDIAIGTSSVHLVLHQTTICRNNYLFIIPSQWNAESYDAVKNAISSPPKRFNDEARRLTSTNSYAMTLQSSFNKTGSGLWIEMSVDNMFYELYRLLQQPRRPTKFPTVSVISWSADYSSNTSFYSQLALQSSSRERYIKNDLHLPPQHGTFQRQATYKDTDNTHGTQLKDTKSIQATYNNIYY